MMQLHLAQLPGLKPFQETINMLRKNTQKKELSTETHSEMTCAVIDIGTTAIRMTIAHIESNSKITVIDTLQQAVSLGKDTFTKGFICKTSIEDCVRVLKSYRRTLKEYGIDSENYVRIIATTAVREASNRDAFIDRIFIATGLNVEVIDEIDIARLTYLSVKSCRDTNNFQWGNRLLIAEISGGSTEILHFDHEKVILSHNYRLGSLRMREALDEIPAPLKRHRDLMENDINRTVNQISNDIDMNMQLSLITLGGDIRTAASHIYPDWNNDEPLKVSVPLLLKFVNDIFSLTTDEIVQQFHISFADAETLGPALLFYYHLARILNLKTIIVTGISMRHGVLIEISQRGSRSNEFVQQIIHSALETGRKFQFDERHATNVADLSVKLFKAIEKEHGLPQQYELTLRIAALLHNIGSFINVRSHHKHSMYIIQNSELFGLSKSEITIISLIARYHRHSAPKPEHEIYHLLPREQRLIVVKLAAILRIADALDRSDNSRINSMECQVSDEGLIIYVAGIDDFSLEQYSIRSKGTLFEDVYGFNIILRKKEFSEQQ
jgi:exopolyphosphatase/guanosine-5'-triphosphate,3'-diphosphate pyrophosphatase